MADLTIKEKLFVRYFLLYRNGTKAAKEAGYEPERAGVTASILMQKGKVRNEIKRLIASKTAMLEITLKDVVQELSKIAFSDLRNYVSWDNTDVKIHNSEILDNNTGPAVSEVSLHETQTEKGASRNVKVKLHDKVRALEILGKYLQYAEEKTVDKNNERDLNNYTQQELIQMAKDKIKQLEMKKEIKDVGEEKPDSDCQGTSQNSE